jgi:hypothetical protein
MKDAKHAALFGRQRNGWLNGRANRQHFIRRDNLRAGGSIQRLFKPTAFSSG